MSQKIDSESSFLQQQAGLKQTFQFVSAREYIDKLKQNCLEVEHTISGKIRDTSPAADFLGNDCPDENIPAD